LSLSTGLFSGGAARDKPIHRALMLDSPR